MRIGVDIGGTFTDVALERGDRLFSAKVLTDYAAPEQAILDGIAAVLAQAGAAPGDVTRVIHGTTLVTNALIQRQGARVAFVTTEGFRDVIEMGRESRFEQYDLNIELPRPLIARADRFTLPERVAADGTVVLPLDPRALAALVARIGAAGYEAVAVGFLHAYANPAHERAVAEALHAAMPGLPVSLSSVISPQIREFERFSTTIANAYVQPQVAAYLGRLRARLDGAGVAAPVFMMHSGGGLIGLDLAAEQPVRLLESGPAGGAIFAAGFARAHGIARALSFDMGGTTAKICLIEGGRPRTAALFEVARSTRFKKGSGMPVSTPVVEMVEIGAGGGSIAGLDGMGRITVGPASAGSEPGPACYGRGGTAPTVTDANLVLGRLDPAHFAGGAIVLDPGAAEAALATHMPGLAPTEAAVGITEMVDENMANAARVHAVENGRDIEEFTMIAFGGGAPLHACRLAEKLGIDRLLIPPGAGVGSAIGFLRAPFSFEATRGFFQRLDRYDSGAASRLLAELEAEARAFVATGADDAAMTTRLTLFMRYSGQGWEIPVEVAQQDATGPEAPALLRARFEAEYRGLFGRIIADLAVEVTNWSLGLASSLPPVLAVTRRGPGNPATPAGQRPVHDAALRRRVSAQVIARRALAPGQSLAGPAVIIEEETTSIVTASFTVTAQEDGCLLLERKPG